MNTAAKRSILTVNHPPKAFTLTGKAYACYQAGTKMGGHAAYQVASENLRRVKVHQGQQLIALRDQLLNHKTHPIPDDHPLKEAIEGLPILAEGMEAIAVQFDIEASKMQGEGSQMMGQVAAQDTAEDARWRPPLRAWALLTAAMTVATTISTLVAIAFRDGWW